MTPGVLESTSFVVQEASHVRIDDEALAARCREWREQRVETPGWDARIHWADGGPRTANYVLVLDALNFCFWADPGQPRWSVDYAGTTYNGYNALAAALKRAVEEGIPVTEAAYLEQLSEEQLRHVLRGQNMIPMIPERLHNAREVGRVLRERYQGEFVQAIEACRGSAVVLANLLADQFPCFRDVTTYRGREVRLLKRAQITVVDLFGSYRGEGPGHFHDLAQLTAFADYKIPQVLEAQGILRYTPELAARIDRQEQLPAGSEEEVEIRAAMVWAVDRIARALDKAPYEIDWLLWNVGQRPVPNERPYHRTRTIFY